MLFAIVVARFYIYYVLFWAIIHKYIADSVFYFPHFVIVILYIYGVLGAGEQ